MQWQKRRRFHSRTFGQGLQQRLLAGNICSRYDSQMGSYAPNADAVNTTISAHDIPANANTVADRPQLPLEL